MQLKKLKDWNAIKKFGLFWKLELDTSAIKCKIWTELQFLKVLGLKCNNNKIG